jgi:hypothetical protein
MFSMRTKKALSDVIATMIMVSLVFVAAGVLFVVVRNLVEIELSPPDLCLEEKLRIQEVCYNNRTNDLEINLFRRAGVEFEVIYFSIEFEKDSLLFHCCRDCEDCRVMESGRKKYFIGLDEMPKKLKIESDNCLEGQRVVKEC